MADLNAITMNDVLNYAIEGFKPWFRNAPTHVIAQAVVDTLAAHDAALRAQIAADIRAAVSRDYDSEADAFFLDGVLYAARIAEGGLRT